jgi:hypothetical protein
MLVTSYRETGGHRPPLQWGVPSKVSIERPWALSLLKQEFVMLRTARLPGVYP